MGDAEETQAPRRQSQIVNRNSSIANRRSGLRLDTPLDFVRSAIRSGPSSAIDPVSRRRHTARRAA